MPAIQLARVKSQVDQLIWQFTRPQDFQRELRNLLESYADWSFHTGEAVEPASLLPAYHVTDMLLHQIEQQLTRPCQEMPAAALALADLLWQNPYFEPRLLAAFILGQTPLKPMDEISRRIKGWCLPTLDKQLQMAIFTYATVRFRREKPFGWLEIISEWVSTGLVDQKVMGLRAINTILDDPDFEYLPAIFSILQSLLLTAPSRLQGDLVVVLQSLARRSPVETTHFLRQILSSSSNAIPGRIVRQILPGLTPDLQASLRNAMSAHQ